MNELINNKYKELFTKYDKNKIYATINYYANWLGESKSSPYTETSIVTKCKEFILDVGKLEYTGGLKGCLKSWSQLFKHLKPEFVTLANALYDNGFNIPYNPRYIFEPYKNLDIGSIKVIIVSNGNPSWYSGFPQELVEDLVKYGIMIDKGQKLNVGKWLDQGVLFIDDKLGDLDCYNELFNKLINIVMNTKKDIILLNLTDKTEIGLELLKTNLILLNRGKKEIDWNLNSTTPLSEELFSGDIEQLKLAIDKSELSEHGKQRMFSIINTMTSETDEQELVNSLITENWDTKKKDDVIIENIEDLPLVSDKPKELYAFTDGSYVRKTGICRWAYCIVDSLENYDSPKDRIVFELNGDINEQQTSNRAELMAILRCLDHIHTLEYETAHIFSDSEYSVKTINNNYNKWSEKDRILKKNLDLLDPIMEFLDGKPIKITHIPASHNMTEPLEKNIAWSRWYFNDYVDGLAKNN